MKQKMMQDLKGDAILARNGKLGSLKDVYFDDERWTVCYFVVDTGGWFSGREALISPHLVRAHEGRARELQVELTREELERAPGPAEHPPASRLHEAARGAASAYPAYRSAPYLWVGTPSPLAVPPPQLERDPGDARNEAAVQAQKRAEQSHLRSAAELVGYHIHARDGDLGHVEDFVVESDTWTITGMVVDTRNWLPGKKVLVPPSAVESVDWHARRVAVRRTRAELERSPEPR